MEQAFAQTPEDVHQVIRSVNNAVNYIERLTAKKAIGRIGVARHSDLGKQQMLDVVPKCLV